MKAGELKTEDLHWFEVLFALTDRELGSLLRSKLHLALDPVSFNTRYDRAAEGLIRVHPAVVAMELPDKFRVATKALLQQLKGKNVVLFRCSFYRTYEQSILSIDAAGKTRK